MGRKYHNDIQHNVSGLEHRNDAMWREATKQRSTLRREGIMNANVL